MTTIWIFEILNRYVPHVWYSLDYTEKAHSEANEFCGRQKSLKFESSLPYFLCARGTSRDKGMQYDRDNSLESRSTTKAGPDQTRPDQIGLSSWSVLRSYTNNCHTLGMSTVKPKHYFLLLMSSWYIFLTSWKWVNNSKKYSKKQAEFYFCTSVWYEPTD